MSITNNSNPSGNNGNGYDNKKGTKSPSVSNPGKAIPSQYGRVEERAVKRPVPGEKSR